MRRPVEPEPNGKTARLAKRRHEKGSISLPINDVYLAGPLFSNAERRWNSALKQYLTKCGFTVFAPQDEVPHDATPAQRQRACLTGLRASRLVLAILDGPDADSGTSWEAGYTKAKGRKVVGVRTDFRRCEYHHVNLMLHYSVTSLLQYTDMDDRTLFPIIASELQKHLQTRARRYKIPRAQSRP
jgi:nucleoside 2-deoxyribosyltransferase